MTLSDIRQIMRLPTSPTAKRIADLFQRRHNTGWADKEVRAFRKIDFQEQDLALLERYYAAERRKGDKGVHRRDLFTFLGNYSGELDRARYWSARVNRPNGSKKPKEMGAASEKDFSEAGKLARAEVERLRGELFRS